MSPSLPYTATVDGRNYSAVYTPSVSGYPISTSSPPTFLPITHSLYNNIVKTTDVIGEYNSVVDEMDYCYTNPLFHEQTFTSNMVTDTDMFYYDDMLGADMRAALDMLWHHDPMLIDV